MTLNTLANIPAPADAQHVAEWVDENGDGMRWGRYVRGSRRDTAGVALTLCGWQGRKRRCRAARDRVGSW
jgi:hypothetical protein